MAFGRKKISAEVDIDSFEDDLDEQDRALEDAELQAELDRTEREERLAQLSTTRGPWDLADAPEVEVPRLDLGGLQVTIVADTDIRVEVSPEGEVVAATIVHGESSLQLNAFAAPRSEGIWLEVLGEIRDSLNSGGGQAQQGEGPLGPELRAAVPTEVPGQGVVLAPARFVGVDGPRWFLRGLVTGPGATDDAAALPLLEAMRQVVVVRGDDPMAVRDPLPLALPAEALQAAQESAEEQGLEMPVRGPEITETR